MISRKESDALFKQLDIDGNGVVSFIEAKAGAKKLKVIFKSHFSQHHHHHHFIGWRQAAGMTAAVRSFWQIADADGDKNLTPGTY